MLEGAPERCKTRMPSRKSPRDPKFWDEALAQVEECWLEGPSGFSRDAGLHLPGKELGRNPSFRFGGTPLGSAKADHEAAYKQLPLRPEKGRLATITHRDPSTGGRMAFPPNTGLSGGATAILRYNCLCRITATLATRLLGIPTLGFLDDFGLATPLPPAEEALLAFTRLNEIFVFLLKLSKSERSHISQFFGLILDLSPIPGGPPPLNLYQFKRDDLETQICETAAPQELVGNSFAQTSTAGQVARSILRPFFQSISDVEFRALPRPFRAALEWRYQALSVCGPRSHLCAHSYRCAHLYRCGGPRRVRRPHFRRSFHNARSLFAHIQGFSG